MSNNFQGVFGLAGVAEADVLEAQRAGGAGEAAGGGVDLGRGVEELEDALGAGQTALDHRVDVGQAADRLEQHRHGGDEGDEFAGAQLILGR